MRRVNPARWTFANQGVRLLNVVLEVIASIAQDGVPGLFWGLLVAGLVHLGFFTDRRETSGLFLPLASASRYFSLQALYESMMIEIPLASFFLSKMLGQKNLNVDIDHLQSLDPEIYKNLLYLKVRKIVVVDGDSEVMFF